MKEHPVSGYNLVQILEDDFSNKGEMQSYLQYQRKGAEHLEISLFAEDYQGYPLYQTFIPQYGGIDKKLIQRVLFLIADIMDVEERSFRFDVHNYRVDGVDGFSVFIISDDGSSKVHEHKLISTILWFSVAMIWLSQDAPWDNNAA